MCKFCANLHNLKRIVMPTAIKEIKCCPMCGRILSEATWIDELRLRELIKCFTDCVEARLPIPPELIEEYNELTKKKGEE